MRLLAVGCILAFAGWPSRGHAQAANADSVRSTRTGVYTTTQVEFGRDIYVMNCASCHTTVSHTGPGFVAAWHGRRLWDLFRYVSERMPKSQPGSLSQREYARVVAYLLMMNGMPAGSDELVADSTALKRVQIELKTAGDSTQRKGPDRW